MKTSVTGCYTRSTSWHSVSLDYMLDHSIASFAVEWRSKYHYGAVKCIVMLHT